MFEGADYPMGGWIERWLCGDKIGVEETKKRQLTHNNNANNNGDKTDHT